MPIHPDVRHYTTFITPWGRYEYLVVPQGFISTGDGYCQRFDQIVELFLNHRKLVDDSVLWASTVEALVLLTCEFLTHCSANGVIFNESKFQFCKRTVEFVGFLVSDTGLRPTGEMLRTLGEFPRPADLTGVRSFFGLVEQVSWAFAKTDAMAPFRQLLKTKEAFVWTQELQTAFEVARENIVNQVKEGVTNFVVGRRTAMCTDWSKV